MTIAHVRIKLHSPGGCELTGEETETLEIPSANYAVEDVIRHEGRRLIVTGREWEGGKVVQVSCTERRAVSNGRINEEVGARVAARKGRAA